MTLPAGYFTTICLPSKCLSMNWKPHSASTSPILWFMNRSLPSRLNVWKLRIKTIDTYVMGQLSFVNAYCIYAWLVTFETKTLWSHNHNIISPTNNPREKQVWWISCSEQCFFKNKWFTVRQPDGIHQMGTVSYSFLAVLMMILSYSGFSNFIYLWSVLLL